MRDSVDAGEDRGGGDGGGKAMESIAAQRRILDEVSRANRSVWAWFPPIFVLAFSTLSFAGTYIGLRDIIATGDARGGWVGEALVFALVALATGAMVYFLRQATLKFWSLGGIAAFAAYLLLLFFSVTFGFAFYWGRLEASNQAIAGARGKIESLSDQIQTSAFALKSTADGLTALSVEFRQLAEKERTVGGTCGDGSAGGYGPRTRHRERRAQEIEGLVTQIQPRFAAVQGPVAAMEAELGKIDQLRTPEVAPIGVDPAAARVAQFKETRQAARLAAVEINALANDPGLRALGGQFKEWGREYMDPTLVRGDDPQGAAYQCIQPTAGQLLLTAGAQLENLPMVAAPDLPAYAGPGATREAVFRMLNSVGGLFSGGVGLAFGPAPSPAPIDDGAAGLEPEAAALRGAPEAALVAAPAEGLREEDRFPLAVAIIIDMLLFAFVLIERPGRKYFDRMKRVAEESQVAFKPLRMVALREGLEQDKDWRTLNDFRFDVEDRTFIVAPRGAAPEGERFRAMMIRDVARVFERNGMLRLSRMKPDEVKALLEEVGRQDLQRFHPMDCYEFTQDGLEHLLMVSMADVGKRESELSPPPPRRGLWRRLAAPAPAPAIEDKGPQPEDDVAGAAPPRRLERDDAEWGAGAEARPAAPKRPAWPAAPWRSERPAKEEPSAAEADATLVLDEADRLGEGPADKPKSQRSPWPWRKR